MIRVSTLAAVLAVATGCLSDPATVRAVGEAARCLEYVCDVYAGYPR